VLVLDDVTQIVRRRLEYLGAKIINVDQVIQDLSFISISSFFFLTYKNRSNIHGILVPQEEKGLTKLADIQN
jgi:hypothetical protein